MSDELFTWPEVVDYFHLLYEDLKTNDLTTKAMCAVVRPYGTRHFIWEASAVNMLPDALVGPEHVEYKADITLHAEEAICKYLVYFGDPDKEYILLCSHLPCVYCMKQIFETGPLVCIDKVVVFEKYYNQTLKERPHWEKRAKASIAYWNALNLDVKLEWLK